MAVILFADDDPILREIVADMLRSTEHAAIMAEDGQEVLRLLDTIAIDLLVTDMLMPNVDGVEVIMAVREKHPSVKVLAISSGGSVGASYMLHVAKVLGANATMQKPLELASFLSVVEDLLHDPASEAKPMRAAGR